MIPKKKARWRVRKVEQVFLLLVALLAGSACSQRRVYDHYCHTPLAGWEKTDPVSFDVPPMPASGDYQTEVGLRISNDFPFMSLFLVVSETIVHANEDLPVGRPEETKTVTLSLPLVSHDGRSLGSGLSYQQYAFPVNTLRLQQGDSLHITIRHDMKREIMPGISDIGYTVYKLTD